MNIIVNSENKEYKEQTTLLYILEDLGIENRVMAAALNMNIIKKEDYSSCILNDGDKLELLEFVAGG